MTDKKKESDSGSEPNDAIAQFEKILGEVGADAVSVVIQRFHPKTKRKQYIASVPAEGFSVEDVRRDYGGGRFELRVTGPDNKYMGGKNIEIAGPPKDLEKVEEEPDDFDTEEEIERRVEERTRELRERSVLEIVLEGQKDIARALADLRNPPREAYGVNPVELVGNIMSSMQAMVGPYQQVMLEKMMERDRVDSTDVLDKMIDIFARGTELGRDSQGDAGYATVIRELGRPLVKILEQESHRRAVNPSPGVAPNPSPGAPAVTRDPAPSDGPDWLPVFQPFLPQLFGWASRGKDPELSADWVLDELPDDYLDPVGEQLHRGDEFLAEFKATIPAAEEHWPWLRLFFDRLSSGIVPVERPEPEEEEGDEEEEEGDDELEGKREVSEGASASGDGLG